jgi:hypothetical protein
MSREPEAHTRCCDRCGRPAHRAACGAFICTGCGVHLAMTQHWCGWAMPEAGEHQGEPVKGALSVPSSTTRHR